MHLLRNLYHIKPCFIQFNVLTLDGMLGVVVIRKLMTLYADSCALGNGACNEGVAADNDVFSDDDFQLFENVDDDISVGIGANIFISSMTLPLP